MKALIVEDEIIIAEDIRQVIISLGHEVMDIALKYSQALEVLENHPVDFILIDISLGGAKTGIDLANEINLKYKIPFIFLTSHADAATVAKAKEVKPNGYLLKPFTRDDIFTTLEIALAQKESVLKFQSLIQNISEREREVYESLVQGHTDLEISEKLFISLNTVKTHLKSVYKKLGVKNRLEAATLQARVEN